MIIAGDLSINGTGIAAENGEFYFQTGLKKAVKTTNGIVGISADLVVGHIANGADAERYYTNAIALGSAITRISNGNISDFAVEGYAYSYASSSSSSGRVFDIGEFSGMVKFIAASMGAKIKTYAPTEIKKFATGRGDASKVLMVDAFFERNGKGIVYDFTQSLGWDKRYKSPIADLVDAWWLLQLHSSGSG